jgi:TPR repeat protein
MGYALWSVEATGEAIDYAISNKQGSGYPLDPQSLDVPSLEAQAREGDAEAAWQLYAFADLPEADAWKWLCLAANGKYAEARNELGRLYWYGVEPVKEDRVRGYMWYKLAAKRSKSAAHEVKELQHELSAEQLAEAERLATAWKPAPESCEVQAKQAK